MSQELIVLLPRPKNFKFNAKQVLLTYPKCPLTPDKVLEGLQARFEISTYTISSERHQDGTPHIHALLKFSKKVHTESHAHFDLGFYHCNIKGLKTVGDFNRTHEYVIKDGVYITTFKQASSNSVALANAILEAGSLTRQLILDNPTLIFKNYSSIKSWLAVVSPQKVKAVIYQKRRHLWITGPSNIGKSYYLNAFISCFYNPQEIPFNNDFSHVDPSCDLLYADEYSGQLTVQQINRLCDGNTRLNTKGSSTCIAYPLVVICSNFTIRSCYRNISDDIYDTLLNRFIEYDLSISKPAFPSSIIKT
nr:MAG: replication associated protein [Cressdnaviricota sp.]